MVKPSTPRLLHVRPHHQRPRNSWSGARKDVLRASLVTAAVVLVLTVVLVPVLVTQLAVQRRSQTDAGLPQLLDLSYCQALSEGASHCQEYAQASGGDKFIAATSWRQMQRASFDCSGIEVSCLNADIHAKAPGSSCHVLADGTRCGEAGNSCQQGFCGGRLPISSSASSSSSSSSASNDGGTALDDDLRVDAKKAFQSSKGLDGRIDARSSTPDTASTQQTTDGTAEPRAPAVAAAAPAPSQPAAAVIPPAVPAAANTTWPTAVAAIWPSNLGVRVPETFLATSHEWKRITDYGGVNVAAWAEIFRLLSPSPVLRIGGSSQDAMTEVPGPEVWAALRNLQAAANARFIIGLPLFQKDAPSMARQIMRDAFKHLGSALIGFELGNEPEFWPTGLGGYDESGAWQSGFEAFAAYFHRVALELNPCGAGGKHTPLLSGPGWGNVNTQDPSWFAKVVNQGSCYLWESNTHFYPYINNETVTAPELLSQWLQDFGLDKFKGYAKIAKAAKLDIRISETNSLYGGGRVGLSDTAVGAFWVADALFAFANAGARAFHLHWGKGGEPSGNSQPNTGVQTNFEWKVPPGQPPMPYPSVHAPWFGYMFWVVASAGGYGKAADTSFVPANVEKWDACTANIKVYGLRGATEVRIALLNKDLEKSCNMDLVIEDKYCTEQASLSRLLPSKGMLSKAGITWQGQHYLGAGTTGKLGGEREAVAVPLRKFEGGRCGYTVAMPAATAALLVFKPSNLGQAT